MGFSTSSHLSIWISGSGWTMQWKDAVPMILAVIPTALYVLIFLF